MIHGESFIHLSLPAVRTEWILTLSVCFDAQDDRHPSSMTNATSRILPPLKLASLVKSSNHQSQSGSALQRSALQRPSRNLLRGNVSLFLSLLLYYSAQQYLSDLPLSSPELPSLSRRPPPETTPIQPEMLMRPRSGGLKSRVLAVGLGVNARVFARTRPLPPELTRKGITGAGRGSEIWLRHRTRRYR